LEEIQHEKYPKVSQSYAIRTFPLLLVLKVTSVFGGW